MMTQTSTTQPLSSSSFTELTSSSSPAQQRPSTNTTTTKVTTSRPRRVRSGSSLLRFRRRRSSATTISEESTCSSQSGDDPTNMIPTEQSQQQSQSQKRRQRRPRRHSMNSSSTGAGGSTKRKSLLRRLSTGFTRRLSRSSGSSHHSQQLASSSDNEKAIDEMIASRMAELSTTAKDKHDQLQYLDERGLLEQSAGQLELALNTWEEALAIVTEKDTKLACKLQCQLISLYLQLHQQEQQKQSTSMSTSKSTTHLNAAKELISQLNHEIIQQQQQQSQQWLTPSESLLELLMTMRIWDLALLIAYGLQEIELSNNKSSSLALTVARLHLEMALQQHSQTIVLSHLSECHQILLSLSSAASDVDNTVSKERLSVTWQELAEAYVAQDDGELAIACAQSRFQLLTTPKELAMAHYDQALQIYSPLERYDVALQEVDMGLQALELDQAQQEEQEATNSASSSTTNNNNAPAAESTNSTTTLALKLLHCKADILCRLNRWEESLQVYERLIQGYAMSPHHGYADAANVLYIMGKVCTHEKQYSAALSYLDRELHMTKTVVGPHHMAVSKILHELAKVAEVGLNDYPRAIQYYQEALIVESKVYQTCRQTIAEHQPPKQHSTSKNHHSSSSSNKGSSSFYPKKNKMQVSDAPAMLSRDNNTSSNKDKLIQSQKLLLQDAKIQMAETKRRLGNVHFKMGDFDKALRTSLA